MASPLWMSYQDPATRDLIEMLQHAARNGDVAAQQQLASLSDKIAVQEASTGVIPGLSGRIDPNYLGNVVPGRPRYTRPVGMTDADVDYWTRYGGPFNLMSRQPAQGAARGVTAMPRAGSSGYADVARHRATQTSPLPMGLPSGYGQEEGGMEDPYTGLRPSGTFARGGEEHDPRIGGRWNFDYGMPTGWFWHGGSGGTSGDPVNFGRVGGDREGRTRPVEAEEGPGIGFSSAALSKASEMIAAAGGSQDYGRAFTTRMGTRKFQPYMTTPQVAQYAGPYLRREEEEK